MTEKWIVTTTDDAIIETIENALDAVEDDLDVSIRQSRGRPAEDEIKVAAALAELAAAYTGYDARSDEARADPAD